MIINTIISVSDHEHGTVAMITDEMWIRDHGTCRNIGNSKQIIKMVLCSNDNNFVVYIKIFSLSGNILSRIVMAVICRS